MSKKKDIIVNKDIKKVVNEEIIGKNLEVVESPIVEMDVIIEKPIEDAKIEESIVDNAVEPENELIEESINQEVVNEEIIESNDEIVNETVSVSIKAVTENPKNRKIIIATPTYFVVEKDGSNVVVYEQNSYRRGDTVLY